MKILILSPLFPPDTGAPASYVKELAARLAPTHDTHLLVYGYLPEAVSGVTIMTADKRLILPTRLFLYTTSFFRQHNELILVNNAPSVELPLLIVSLFKKIPYVLIESDPIASLASERGWYKILHTVVQRRAKKCIKLDSEALYKKAEILPFVTPDPVLESKRDAWWLTHLNHILS